MSVIADVSNRPCPLLWVQYKGVPEMINFDEEIKKFHKSLEIEDVQNAIYNQDMKDMVDVMIRMAKDGAYGAESTPAHGINPAGSMPIL